MPSCAASAKQIRAGGNPEHFSTSLARRTWGLNEVVQLIAEFAQSTETRLLVDPRNPVEASTNDLAIEDWSSQFETHRLDPEPNGPTASSGAPNCSR